MTGRPPLYRRSRFLEGIGAAGLGAAVYASGCARFDSAAPLRVWSFNHFEGYEAMLRAQLAAFEASNPGIRTAYEILAWAEEDDKLTVAMASGRPPDVLWGALDLRWIASGLQKPVDDYLTAVDRIDYYPGALDVMRFDKKLWGFPLYQTFYCMAANAQMLEERGIEWRAVQERGWTWDEFVTRCKRLIAPGRYPFVFYTHPTPELWSWFALNNGVTDADAGGLRADGTFGWNREEVSDSLRFLVDTYSSYKIAPPQEPAFTDETQSDLFFEGRAAVSARQGPYVIKAQERIRQSLARGKPVRAGYLSFPVVLLPFPHNPPAAQRAHAGGGGYMVFRQKGADDRGRVERAMHLARFLGDTDGMLFAAKLSLLPARRSGVRKFAAMLDLHSPNMRFFVRYLSDAAPRVYPPLDVGASRESRVLEVAIMPNWEAALSGEKSPTQAVGDMASTAGDVLRGT